jgi:hypothetical protein
MNKSIKKEKIFNNTIGFVLVPLSFLLFLQFSCNNTSDNKGVDNVDMTKVANEINKKCPMTVDSITRLDNTAALFNNTFEYNFTILNADKADYDTNLLKEVVKLSALNNIKTNPQSKIFRDNSTSILYVYYDMNGSYLCNILLTPEEYNK